jgi:hypothetical protein
MQPDQRGCATVAGGAGFKRGRQKSALLCWLGGLNVAGAGAWLLRLLRMRPADGSGSRKPLLGSASAKDAVGATAAASAGLTASATGLEASHPSLLILLGGTSSKLEWRQNCLTSCSQVFEPSAAATCRLLDHTVKWTGLCCLWAAWQC